MKQAVKDAIEKLGDGFTIDKLIKEARKKTSPLHGEFEWDKGRAHEIYLKDRAREILREYWAMKTLPGIKEAVGVREYHALQMSDNHNQQRSYFSTSVIMKDPVLVERLLAQALLELSALKRKYASLIALQKVFEEVERVEAKRSKRKNVDNRAVA